MAKKSNPVTEATTITLTPEEIAAVMAIREQQVGSVSSDTAKSVGHKELADALITAINSTKAPAKKTPFNRVRMGPWEPKDGTKKPKLKRVMFQHGVELRDSNLHAAEIDLLNKVKPGSYCGGFIKVIRRKDRSLDIDYPVRTASQRLRLVNQFGITNFESLLARLVAEATDPKKYRSEDEDDE